jgi:NAD-dependent deacetylase
MKKKLVIFSGSGLDSESGISTFRGDDNNCLWDEYNVKDVASIEGWRRNRQLVLDFYNKRHNQLSTVVPNSAHFDIAELEKDYDVINITQNVSDLLERGGSTNILHLHGELTKMRTCLTNEILPWKQGIDLETSSQTDDGESLRPHIVWFGEAVPNMTPAIEIVKEADIFVVIGTSLQVYPAANLLDYVGDDVPIFVVDPQSVVDPYAFDTSRMNITYIKEVATSGVKKLIELLK